jgi:hypothetical protein
MLDATVLEALTRLSPESLAGLVGVAMQASDETIDGVLSVEGPAPEQA